MRMGLLNAKPLGAEVSRAQRRWAGLARYGLALLYVGLALGLALILEHFRFRDGAVPLLLFACAISSWYGGRGPALLAFILSTAAFYWYFIEPVRTIYILRSEIPYFIIFASFCLLIVWFSTVRGRADAVLREQANLLNLTHDTVFVMDLEGVIGYWNRGAEERYGWTAEQAAGKLVHDLLKTVFPAPLEEIKKELISAGHWEGELAHTRKDGTQIVAASRWALQRDKKGAPVAILETNNDITDRKRAEEASHRLNRELRAISDCNQVLLRATDEQTLLEEICRVVCEKAGYRPVWVSWVEHDEAKSVRPAAWAGTDKAYLDHARISWSEETDFGRGPTGIAIRSGKSCCVQDFATDTRVAPWRELLLQGGFCSGIALPLKDEHGNVFGALSMHSERPNAFTADEIHLLEELAGDLAFGIVTLRSRAARERAEQDVALLSFALNEMRDAAFLIGETGDFRYVNDEGCRILGYSRAELLGLGVSDIDPEFPAGRWPDHWRELQTKRSLSFESRHRTRDGRTFPVEVRANFIEYGGRAYNLALVRDITARQQAEEALRESEANLNRAQEIAHIGSWHLDVARNRLIWSDEVFRIFGVPLGTALTYDAFVGMVHPEDRESVDTAWSAALRGAPYDIEHRIVVGGELKWLRERAQVEFGPEGNATSGVGTVQDITERKRAEEKIRQQEMELRQVLDFAPQLIAMFGPEGERLYANQPTLDYFGVTQQEWESISDRYWFYHPDDRERLARDVYAEPGGDVPNEFEARMRRKDGAYLWFLCRHNAVRDEEGRIVRWYTTGADIEDRKRAEEERRARVWFLESMDRINRAMQGTNDLEQMMGDVADAMLSIFESDRVFLYHPCDPDAPGFELAFARTRPEYQIERGVVPMTPETATGFRIMLASSGAVTFGPGCDLPVVGGFADRFGHESAIGVTLYPKTGEPWVLTMHQCSYARVWTADERRLLEEVARRVADALTSLLMFRGLREREEALRRSEAYLAEAQRLAHTGSFAADSSTKPLFWSEELYRIFGFDPQQGLPTREQPRERIHPEDMERFLRAWDKAINQKVDAEVEYRIVLPDQAIKHAHGIAHPVLNSKGEVVEVVGTVIDITERKRRDDELRASQDRLARERDRANLLLEINNHLIAKLEVADLLPAVAGPIRKCLGSDLISFLLLNKETGCLERKFLDFPKGKGILEKTSVAMPSKLLEEWWQARKPVFYSPPEAEIPAALREADRAESILSAVSIPLMGVDGPLGLLNIASQKANAFDAADRDLLSQIGTQMSLALDNALAYEALRASREALRRSEAYLADAQRLSHTGSFAFDIATNRYVYVSEECCRIFELDPKGSTREAVSRNIHPEDWDKVRRDLEKTLREKVDTLSEFRFVLPGAATKHIQAIRHPILNETGDVVTVMGTAIDITERKRAEEALRESEARFRTFVDHAADAFCVFDEQHRIVEANREACEGHGYTREEVIGAVPQDFDPDVDAAMLHWIDDQIAAGKVCTFETRNRRKDGTLFPVEVRVRAFELGGRRFHLVATRDISERKRAEEALRLSNAYNRSLIEASLDPLVTIGPDGTITDVNAATEAATGRSRRELIGTDFCDYFSEPAKARAGYQQVFREGPVRDYPLELRHRDGRLMSVLYNASIYRDESGQVIGVFAAARDITERKRAEDALRESDARFRTFVDHAADAFFMLDFEQGTILDVNRQACESLGYTREDLIGMTPLAFDVDLDRATLESIAPRAAAGETVSFDRHWHRRKDGSVLPVEIQTSLFWYGGRRLLLKVARDISDHLRVEEQRDKLRQLEADLAHINRVSMMGELAASIAHEVNQPIAGVVSNGSACLRWLARDVPDLEEAREAARRIVRDGKRAGEIIARIRALTKRTAAAAEKLDLNQTIGEVVVLVGDEAKRKSVVIRTQFANDAFAVLGDRVQLQQVILNLVMNGIEAMSSVGDRARELAITTRNIDAGQVQTTVEDSGTGVDPSAIDKIFDPFYTTKHGGMGMGLSICRSIVQAHGGRIWATANHGRGMSFHFGLPKYHEERSHAKVAAG